jgi:hypothetical protein
MEKPVTVPGVVAAASTELPDAASGFRAYSRASLLRLNVVTQFSYRMETIIQAGNKRSWSGSRRCSTARKAVGSPPRVATRGRHT